VSPRIGRRQFVTLLGGAAAWPMAARAQQPRMSMIGLLSSRSSAVDMSLIAVFRQALNETGFVEGQNVIIDYRWAEGHYDRLTELAADLVRQQVAIIVTIFRPSGQGGDLDHTDCLCEWHRPA
jgi:ABC-type uncharacterized transport system substrate-binding protein